jgi:hypothetical protein
LAFRWAGRGGINHPRRSEGRPALSFSCEATRRRPVAFV